jgi:trehalose-6-phosphate synthase
MGASALLVSPLDIEGTSEAMAWALDMPMAEREARLARLRGQAESWTAGHWLSAQLEALNISRVSEATAITDDSGPTKANAMLHH